MSKNFVKSIKALRQRADEVNLKDSKTFKYVYGIVEKMRDLLRENENLVALAAPQIRKRIRVFCIKFANNDIRTFINPLVTYRKGSHLSRENQIGVSKKEYIVPRNNEINATYQTPAGAIESNKFEGMPGEVFQQMIDLLDGVPLADIALEIIPEFDEATDEERFEVIKYYLNGLRMRADALDFKIESNPEAKALNKTIDILTKLQTGEMTITPVTEEEEEK